MDTKKRARLWPIAVLLVIAYLVAFPNRLAREIVVRPAWSARIASPVRLARQERQPLGFRVGEVFGYVDVGGELLRLDPVPFDVTLNDTFYANLAKGGETVVVRRWDGSVVASLGQEAWPLLSRGMDDRLYLFTTDLLGLSEVGLDGLTRWQRSFTSLITCFALPGAEADGPARCAVGTLDGRLRVVGGDGADLFVVGSGASRIAGAYGCAVSGRGDRIAAVLGLDPQRLVALESSGGTYREAWSRPLETEVRTERALCYSGDSRYLLVDGAPGIQVLEAGGRRSWGIRSAGSLLAAAPVGAQMAAEMRTEAGDGELLVIVLPDLVLSRASLPPGPPSSRYLAGYDGYLLYGVTGHLSRLDVLRL